MKEYTLGVRMEEGPIYANKMVCEGHKSKGGFYFTKADGTEKERQHGRSLDIDGRTISAQPISEFGFTLADFENVPVNELGLKTIATLNSGIELMVTANGLFIVYDKGVPSLVGAPSAHYLISGPIIQSDGRVKLPETSCFSHPTLNNLLVQNTSLSFNKTVVNGFEIIHWVSVDDRADSIKTDGVRPMLEEEAQYSMYLTSVPKINLQALADKINNRIKYNKERGKDNDPWLISTEGNPISEKQKEEEVKAPGEHPAIKNSLSDYTGMKSISEDPKIVD